MLGVFSETKAPFAQEVVDHVDEFTNRYLGKYQPTGDIVVASSIVAIVGDLLVVPGTERVHPDAELVKEALAVAPADIKSTVFDDSGSTDQAYNIAFLTGPGGQAALAAFGFLPAPTAGS